MSRVSHTCDSDAQCWRSTFIADAPALLFQLRVLHSPLQLLLQLLPPGSQRLGDVKQADWSAWRALACSCSFSDAASLWDDSSSCSPSLALSSNSAIASISRTRARRSVSCSRCGNMVGKGACVGEGGELRCGGRAGAGDLGRLQRSLRMLLVCL
jgi:hypothetical protein